MKKPKPDLRKALIGAALSHGTLTIHKYRYRDESARKITHRMLKQGFLLKTSEDSENRYYVPTKKLRDWQAEQHREQSRKAQQPNRLKGEERDD